MARTVGGKGPTPASAATPARTPGRVRTSALLDTRVIYCGDNLEQLPKLPDACVDLIYIDPPYLRLARLHTTRFVAPSAAGQYA